MSMLNSVFNKENKSSLPADKETQVSLWDFVPVTDYAVPSLPAQSAATNAWASLRQIFGHKNSGSKENSKNDVELGTLSEERLSNVVPSLTWNSAATALETALADWLASGLSKKNPQFVIGQPFSGHAAIVSLLGDRHQAQFITSPSIEQILGKDENWFDSWPSSGNLWVLPKLEHCYFRHTNGLTLVRRFLNLAARGLLGKGVIGCDSWAWSYLQRILPMTYFDAITLQAFDADRLHDFFCKMPFARSDKRIQFQNAINGNSIFSIPVEKKEPQAELVQLAAHCRGNVAIALNYWRKRLRSQPDGTDFSVPQKNKKQSDDTTFDETVWVAGMPPAPELPTAKDEEWILMLHSILLHGGLPETMICELLPFSATRCHGVLMRLKNAGLVSCVAGRWNVSQSAYASVRRSLSAFGYLTDQF